MLRALKLAVLAAITVVSSASLFVAGAFAAATVTDSGPQHIEGDRALPCVGQSAYSEDITIVETRRKNSVTIKVTGTMTGTPENAGLSYTGKLTFVSRDTLTDDAPPAITASWTGKRSDGPSFSFRATGWWEVNEQGEQVAEHWTDSTCKGVATREEFPLNMELTRAVPCFPVPGALNLNANMVITKDNTRKDTMKENGTLAFTPFESDVTFTGELSFVATADDLDQPGTEPTLRATWTGVSSTGNPFRIVANGVSIPNPDGTDDGFEHWQTVSGCQSMYRSMTY